MIVSNDIIISQKVFWIDDGSGFVSRVETSEAEIALDSDIDSDFDLDQLVIKPGLCNRMSKVLGN
jgi:hypothetical protein